MTSTPPPKKPLPPLNKRPNLPPPPSNQAGNRKVSFGSVAANTHGHRVVLYGPGGIGKTTLACQLPGKSAFIDSDESLPKLKLQLEASGIPVPVLVPCVDWLTMNDMLNADGWSGIDNIIIDSGTKTEEWCVEKTLRTVKNDKGLLVTKLEDFGYGKGYRHVYDNWLPLLANLDRHVRQGRNVVLVCHDDTKTVPNPAGLDWLRWEPKLQDSKGCSIRLRVKEWSDHTLFFGYDVDVDDQGNKKARTGKGKGAGSRTIYTAELPYFMAKSRTTSEQIVVDGSADVWSHIIK